MGYPQPYPTAMPRWVRAAQLTAYVSAGVTVVAAIVAGAVDHSAHTAGFVLGMNFLGFIAFGLALGFGRGGRAVRVGAIVCASLGVVVGLGGLARQGPVMLVELAVSVFMVVALSLTESGAWFRRPRG
jgi:hypothetical protein